MSLPPFCNPELPSTDHLEFDAPKFFEATSEQQSASEAEKNAVEELQERAKKLQVFIDEESDADLKQQLIVKLQKMGAEIETRNQARLANESKIFDALEEQNKQIRAAAHKTNATLLAERVIHKYRKYYIARFIADTGVDFYDGSEAIDSKDNPITFDPVFVESLQAEAAKHDGIQTATILNRLHIGVDCAKRFKDFIKVATLPEAKKCSFCGDYHKK